MKRRALTAASLLALSSAFVSANGAPPSEPADRPAASMIILPGGTQASSKGSAQLFTGSVRIDPLLPQPQPPARVSAAYVTFEPGARSAWHTHPLGQLLIVTAGAGWVQQEGGDKQPVRAGDVIWTPPGVKHWHGATATTSMTHIAVQESLDGKNVDWLEKVSDEQYQGHDKPQR